MLGEQALYLVQFARGADFPTFLVNHAHAHEKVPGQGLFGPGGGVDFYRETLRHAGRQRLGQGLAAVG